MAVKEPVLIPIFAGDHSSAQLLRELLEREGVPATLRDRVASSVRQDLIPARIVVAQADLDRARPIVQQFLAARPQGEAAPAGPRDGADG